MFSEIKLFFFCRIGDERFFWRELPQLPPHPAALISRRFRSHFRDVSERFVVVFSFFLVVFEMADLAPRVSRDCVTSMMNSRLSG